LTYIIVLFWRNTMKRIMLYTLFICTIISYVPTNYSKNCTQKCYPSDCIEPCECRINSKTFFTLHEPFKTGSPEHDTIFNDRLISKKNGLHGVTQVVAFGGRSTSPETFSTYFAPDCQTSFIVSETEEDDTDILARHFNILTKNKVLELTDQSNEELATFKSRIYIRPQSSHAGIGLSYKQAFWEYDNGTRRLWFEVTGPLVHIENSMNLSEEVISTGGGPADTVNLPDNKALPATMTEAFNQSDFCYGRIDTCRKISETKLAHVDIKVGLFFAKEEMCQLESYLGVTCPTGNCPTGNYIFEPIVGNNHHWGFITGSLARFSVWCNSKEENSLETVFTMHNQYLFSGVERRSFDVKNKPWSRYMNVYTSKQQAQEASDLASESPDDVSFQALLGGNSGINVFTQPVCVDPRFSSTINTALVFTHAHFQGEVGYNFYGRASECVTLECPWPDQIAFKHASGEGNTTRIATINNDFIDVEPIPVEDYDTAIIKKEDLNLDSAAHPAMLTHTIYGSLSYRYDDTCYPYFMGIGGSYEIAHDNTGLGRWTVWGKGGFSF